MAALGLHTVVEAIVGAVYKVSPGNELHTEPSGEDVVIAYRESTAHHHALMLMVVQVSYADLFYIIRFSVNLGENSSPILCHYRVLLP